MAFNEKNNKYKTTLATISLTILTSVAASAQLHTPFLSDNHWLGLTEEQYRQSVYASSRQSADAYLSKKPLYINDNATQQADKALFYARVASLKIKSTHAADSAKAYIETTTNKVYQQRTSYELARYYFAVGNWTEAIVYYEHANISNLSNTEIADSKFELAYCYFNNLQFDKAEASFLAIKEIDGKYYNAGNYYYGLLAYNKADYDNALKSFDRISEQKQYRDIVPYYIAEIYYFKGERAKALSLSKQLIRRQDKLYYDNELYLLAAQCLFEDNAFAEAIPYFEHYYNNSDKVRKQDVYKMGYCYYQTQNWDKAETQFKELSSSQDSLGQTAMYLLGDCYLKSGDKQSAKNAFSICAEMPFNPAQQEASLLLAGKLAFEAGYSTEGSSKIKKLLYDFPQSNYKDEAKTILSEQLIKADDYAEAYQTLSEVAFKNGKYNQLLQKAAYGYALQQLQRNKLNEADQLLTISVGVAENSNYEAAAYFWKAEIAYRTKEYKTALDNDALFLSKNTNDAGVVKISTAATRQHAYLTMGYTAMALEDYDKAQEYFSQSQQSQNTAGYSAQSAADASLREADAAFMKKDFAKAMALYNKTIAAENADADYARYQKSILLGLQSKNGEKEALLKSIIGQKPESKYIAEVHYSLGDLYLDEDKYEDAIKQFQYLTDNNNAKHLAAKAWMKIGFSYQEANKNDNAITAYKKVVSDYPSSNQRSAALDALKNLYVSNNQPAAYVQLLKDNNIATPDQAGLDSVFYAAAETQFASQKYDKAIEGMTSYLQQYPNGAFVTKAHFYKAASLEQKKQNAEALKEYDQVLHNAWSDFTEPAAQHAAVIAYNTNTFAAAENYYGILRNNALGKDNLKTAYRGLMLSAYQQNKLAVSSSYADTLLTLPDLDDATHDEAILLKGTASLDAKNYDNATKFFEQAAQSKNIEIAAEATYHKANILLQQNKLKEAETASNNAIQKTTGSDYWNAKSYLLMADIFVQQKDYFNAKATLQSIIKNIKIDALKKEANQKLEEVKQLEKGKSKLSEG